MRCPERRTILGTAVDATSYGDAMARVMEWARRGESRTVCLGVVATVMEARESPSYRAALESADLVTPDGMPLVWMLRGLGARPASRVYGPELTVAVLGAAQAEGVAVGFYGSREEVLTRLVANLRWRFPRLEVVFHQAPPFRPLSVEEDEAIVHAMRESGARILFVGLGCFRTFCPIGGGSSPTHGNQPIQSPFPGLGRCGHAPRGAHFPGCRHRAGKADANGDR